MPYQLKASEIQFSLFIFWAFAVFYAVDYFYFSEALLDINKATSLQLSLHYPDYVLHETFSTYNVKVAFPSDMPSTWYSSDSGCSC